MIRYRQLNTPQKLRLVMVLVCLLFAVGCIVAAIVSAVGAHR